MAITTDIFHTGADGFDFAPGETIVTILPNVVVHSDDHNGVYSNQPGSVLINKGIILSDSDYAVRFDSLTGNSTINNALGGFISGTEGIELVDGVGTKTLNNFGTIVGTSGDGEFVGQTTDKAIVNNHGTIASSIHGLHLDAITTVVNNFSLIKGGERAIYFNPAVASSHIFITNNVHGVIKGGSESAIYSNGMFTITNFGKIIGDIIDNVDVHDVVFNHGIINGPVHLKGSNDKFDGNGGTSGDVFGGLGDDRLAGGAHADHLHGEDGNDTLTGRLGADRFFFDTALNAVTNVDTITDFTPAQHDKIVLDATYFLNLPVGVLGLGNFHVGGPVNANAQIDYKPSNGFLFYDQDGNGSTYAPIHFATLGIAGHPHPVIHNTDFIVIA